MILSKEKSMAKMIRAMITVAIITTMALVCKSDQVGQVVL